MNNKNPFLHLVSALTLVSGLALPVAAQAQTSTREVRLARELAPAQRASDVFVALVRDLRLERAALSEDSLA